jgi:hypothetical protein
MSKLCMEADPSDGASPGMAWPKVEVVNKPHRGGDGLLEVDTGIAWKQHGPAQGERERGR